MSRCIRSKRALLWSAGIAGAAAVYNYWIRPWQTNWGATKQEINLSLPGDDIVVAPTSVSTRAITIDAPPEEVWPWLIQMGKGRGGLYSYDWLDILFGYLDKPSSDQILPDFQNVRAGDVMPIGKDNDTSDDFYVHIANPNRALVIGANAMNMRNRISWAMILVPFEGNKTRFIVRIRFKGDRGLKGIAKNAILEPTSFIMLRKQMLNIKSTVEELKRTRKELLAS